jgi:hypothetical protein
MRRSWILGLAVIVFAVSASAATAASVHFKKGGEPTCTFSGVGTTSVSATCTGTLSGLSGADLSIPTTLSGFTVYTCTNKGQNPAPGQNRVPTGPTTTPNTLSGGAVKNGNVTYTATGGLTATSATAEQAGCPNNNWTATNPQLTVTNISEQIFQGGELLFTCTASNPNGLSGTVPLSCT